ncbi:MAG TPA: zf-HC2 domain-containing protein [Candidatus Acidoferrales bacterium]|nr:zf-HC2 domain-containing protein [Candidatus Acidoferrales bacterium]
MNCSDIAELAPLQFSGELDPSHAAAFAAHLEGCPACALRIRQQAELDVRLREAVLAETLDADAAALEHAVHARIVAELPAAARHGARDLRTRWILAAAAALLLLAGGFAYRSVVSSRAARVYADAAADHQDEVVLHAHRAWLSEPSAIAALAQSRGVPEGLPELLTPPGYQLERAKLCKLDGQVYLHLVYAGEQGEFSAFVRPRDMQTLHGSVAETSSGKPIYESGRGPAHVAGMQSAHLTAFVVTDQPGDSVMRLAESVAGAL